MSSGGGGTTTVQKSDPWKGIQPYLTGLYGEAKNVYNQSKTSDQYAPFSTVTPFSDTSNNAYNMIADRATAGNPLNGAAQSELLKTINGDYLDPTKNPAWQSAMDSVTNQVNSQFGSAGRTGSGMNSEALSRGLGTAAAGLYSGERSNQLNAINNAPSLANQDYYDANQLLGVGSAQEDKAGQYITDALNRYNYNRDASSNNLAKYSGILNGYAGIGGNTTSTQSGGSSTGGNVLGGLLGVASIASMFCWVAREVYGERNPKWKAFRLWMLMDAPTWFFRLYAKHGEKFSRFISNKPHLKALIRAWMDSRINSFAGV